MQAQFWLTAAAFVFAIGMAAVSARSIWSGHAVAMDAWSAQRPSVPRQWLIMTFWANLVLPVAALAIYAGTSGRFLTAAWNDVAQLLLWSSMSIDAFVSRSRWWFAVTVVFLAFSIYEVATHL